MAPDIVILNGKVLTMDPDRPRAEAVAVASGRIVAVGTSAEIGAMAGPDTKQVDAGGATVLPGFIDSHVHLFAGSVEMGYLDLYGVQGEEAVAAAVRAYADDCPDDRVVFAVQAAYELMGPGRETTRQDLDRVLPDRPLALYAGDHHTIWANTAALELAGILHGGPVEAGAEIVMAEDGTATGKLLEPSAYAPVLSLTRNGGRDMAGLVTGADPVPTPGPEERAKDKAALVAGLKHCASHGITGLHNMDGNFYQMELLAELEAEGELICRVEVPFHMKSHDPIDRLEEAEEMRARYASDHLWCNRVKMFMDGVMESRTGLMLENYPDVDSNGDAVFTPEQFNAACVASDARGFQISTHAIGDLAVRRTLDGYAAAREANGVRDARHRMEHIEIIHPDDLPRLGELDVVASVQPGHAAFGHFFPPHGIREVLRPDQWPYAYAWRAQREHAARMVFSTDWPVMPVDVMPNVRAAVDPMDLGEGWPDQSQGLLETLESYTAGNAWVEFAEDRKGRLAEGFMADIAVMSHDLEAMEPSELGSARAVLTLCGGRVTWEA
ncbi:N-substituted formamide deformylase precursor [Roseovarius sp. THAF27]|uniref:amidohydrolase n=1 Tax=Roseovarius sp. THAF27 TaxID=2587850 RepID=UPI001268B17A|nr:amidohydrolase [Roseovarius sp. THAF27]QFT81822.1 N-substituted formamide deformylase precursor [Roseovarius sp. THAF27]